METTNHKLEQFFTDYEARMGHALSDVPTVDIEATAAAFADCFVEASPAGVLCGHNDAQFRAQIMKGMEFYRSIGTKTMKIVSLTVTPLDGFHVMARVHWDSRYDKQDGNEEQIEFDVIYLLQILDEKPKIFAYIAGDEQKVLQEKGLIPVQAEISD